MSSNVSSDGKSSSRSRHNQSSVESSLRSSIPKSSTSVSTRSRLSSTKGSSSGGSIETSLPDSKSSSYLQSSKPKSSSNGSSSCSHHSSKPGSSLLDSTPNSSQPKSSSSGSGSSRHSSKPGSSRNSSIPSLLPDSTPNSTQPKSSSSGSSSSHHSSKPGSSRNSSSRSLLPDSTPNSSQPKSSSSGATTSHQSSIPKSSKSSSTDKSSLTDPKLPSSHRSSETKSSHSGSTSSHRSSRSKSSSSGSIKAPSPDPPSGNSHQRSEYKRPSSGPIQITVLPTAISNNDSLEHPKSKISSTPNKIQPCVPHHFLQMENKKSSYYCDGCKMRGTGERWTCSNDGCEYTLHRECHYASYPITFGGQTCHFLEQPRRCSEASEVHCSRHGKYCTSCYVCRKTVKGFVYTCQYETSEVDIHPWCAKLEKEIRIDGVEFKLEKHGPPKCLHCHRKTKLQGSCKSVRGWSYVVNYKGYSTSSFHVYCLIEMGIECSLASKTTSNRSINNDNNGASSSNSKVTVMSHGGGINWSKLLNVLVDFINVVLPILFGIHNPIIFIPSMAHLAALGLKELIKFLEEY